MGKAKADGKPERFVEGCNEAKRKIHCSKSGSDYNDLVKPAERKYSKKDFSTYQPKSGTRLAYEYAQQKQRGGKNIEIINLF